MELREGSVVAVRRPEEYVIAVAPDTPSILNSMNEKLTRFNPNFLAGAKPTIYRVHPHIRNEDTEAYEPKLVSIGPFHHGKKELEVMEHLKWKYLHDFLKRNEPNHSLQSYVEALQAQIDDARRHYSEEVHPNSNFFVEMLVLDGCFLLEYFLKIASDKLDSPFWQPKWCPLLMRKDLLLLENQIPLFVLEILFDISKISVPKKKRTLKFMELLVNYVHPTGVGKQTRQKMQEKLLDQNTSDVYHLLHLSYLYELELYELEKGQTSFSSCSYYKKATSDLIFTFIFYLFCCSCLLWKSACVSRRDPKDKKRIRSATYLKEAGIQFKKRTGSSCLNISFRNGIIQMTSLSVQHKTSTYFRNYIAFEQCCPIVGNKFTGYAKFMDDLVDTSDDIRVLEKYDILESKHGDVDEVATLFNALTKGTVLSNRNNYLKKVLDDVNEYCQLDRHSSRAKLVSDYFSNPWSVVSLFAAIILLGVTILQTIYTIISYYKNP